MSVFKSSMRLVSAARTGLSVRRGVPAVSVAVRHGGGGPKPVSNVSEPNGFLFNEKVCVLMMPLNAQKFLYKFWVSLFQLVLTSSTSLHPAIITRRKATERRMGKSICVRHGFQLPFGPNHSIFQARHQVCEYYDTVHLSLCLFLQCECLGS